MKSKDVKKMIKKQDKGFHHYSINFDGKTNSIKLYRDGIFQKDFTIEMWIKT